MLEYFFALVHCWFHLSLKYCFRSSVDICLLSHVLERKLMEQASDSQEFMVSPFLVLCHVFLTIMKGPFGVAIIMQRNHGCCLF